VFDLGGVVLTVAHLATVDAPNEFIGNTYVSWKCTESTQQCWTIKANLIATTTKNNKQAPYTNAKRSPD
jgi:hypothetical protein